jgi:hypothetical protein
MLRFDVCLGITNKCINSSQFIIDRYAPGRHITYNQILHGILLKKTKLACSSKGTDELPEDGTQLPKHVGAAK